MTVKIKILTWRSAVASRGNDRELHEHKEWHKESDRWDSTEFWGWRPYIPLMVESWWSSSDRRKCSNFDGVPVSLRSAGQIPIACSNHEDESWIGSCNHEHKSCFWICPLAEKSFYSPNKIFMSDLHLEKWCELCGCIFLSISLFYVGSWAMSYWNVVGAIPRDLDAEA